MSHEMNLKREKRISPAVYWSLFFISVALIAVGTVYQTSVWILSCPIAIIGAITAGIAKKPLPMILCLLAASVFIVSMMIFAP